jgi:hypothetical protein
MMKRTPILMILCLAAGLVALPAAAGDDPQQKADVTVSLHDGLQQIWIAHDNDKCAIRSDTPEGSDHVLVDGSTFHVSMAESGGSHCDTEKHKYFYFKVYNLDDNAEICRIGVRFVKSGHTWTRSGEAYAEPGYSCFATTTNNVVSISFGKN